jgi:hypothetical protein
MAPKNKTEVVNIRIVGLLIIEQKLCSRDPADAVRSRRSRDGGGRGQVNTLELVKSTGHAASHWGKGDAADARPR